MKRSGLIRLQRERTPLSTAGKVCVMVSLARLLRAAGKPMKLCITKTAHCTVRAVLRTNGTKEKPLNLIPSTQYAANTSNNPAIAQLAIRKAARKEQCKIAIGTTTPTNTAPNTHTTLRLRLMNMPQKLNVNPKTYALNPSTLLLRSSTACRRETIEAMKFSCVVRFLMKRAVRLAVTLLVATVQSAGPGGLYTFLWNNTFLKTL